MTTISASRFGICIRVLATVSLLAGAGSANALDLIPDFFKNKDEGRVIFAGRDQYIKVVPQDEFKNGPAPANEHPVSLNPADLSKALQAITLWKEGGFLDGGDEQLALFPKAQASFIARHAAKAFAEAKPEEDVTFAVVGLVSAFVIAKDKRSTAGRMFFRDGQLNVIIGDMHRVYKYGREKDPTGSEQNIDRRLWPHNVGMRAKPRKQDARMMAIEGMTLGEVNGETRGDWIKIDIQKTITAAKKRELPDGVAEETQKLKEEAAKLALERRQMREEMARLRKQVDQMDSGNSLSSLEERLARLDALKSKQLITEEEYQLKRTEILNDI